MRVQDRAGHCRDPKFEHFASRPYVIGLQDKIFGCGEAVHDFYHVEPQYTCLLDDADRLVVDQIVRCLPSTKQQVSATATCNSAGANAAMEAAPVQRVGKGRQCRPPALAVHFRATPFPRCVCDAAEADNTSAELHGYAFSSSGTHALHGDTPAPCTSAC